MRRRTLAHLSPALAAAIALVVLIAATGTAESGRGSELVIIGNPHHAASWEAAAAFRSAGFFEAATEEAARQAIGADTRVVMVTPSGLPEIKEFAPELLSRGVLLGGIEVSLHELLSVADPSVAIGDGWLRRTEERAIFSLVYRTDCTERFFSDWLDNWDVVGITLELADQAAAQLEAAREWSCREILQQPTR